ncbi:hypothetical protein ACIQUS_26615 [Pseudomonas sp. NPDC090755]|uniref:hypothetical protein n=1 Tax=Pseudomonas sp. NPDC090755 TaxID=3364481 RepID=UPI00383AA3F8
MIGDPVPNQRQQDLDSLSASIDQFFANGGQATKLPGFEYQPRRPHHGRLSDGGDPVARATASERRETLERVRNAAKTMTLLEAVRALGIDRTTLFRISREASIYFQSANKEHKARAVARQAKADAEAKLVELIRANSGIGLSRHFVAKKLGITSHYLKRLAEKHGIDFPRWSDRP